jgi:hypothetical protein
MGWVAAAVCAFALFLSLPQLRAQTAPPNLRPKVVMQKKVIREQDTDIRRFQRVRQVLRHELYRYQRVSKTLRRRLAEKPKVVYRTVASTVGGSIVAFGRSLQARGYSVTGNCAFSCPGPGHAPHSKHYQPCSCAIDITGPDLDSVAAEAREQGFFVLWQVPGHYDHVHADTGGAR